MTIASEKGNRIEPMQIPLRNRPGLYATVDRADHDRLAQHRWGLNNMGTIWRRVGTSGTSESYMVLMAREIMGLPRGDPREVDHINGDRLDNRRRNLRICTHAENMQNQRGSRGGTSGYRGVHREGRRWKAQGTLPGGKRVSIGRFETEDEAGAAALAWRQANMPYATD